MYFLKQLYILKNNLSGEALLLEFTFFLTSMSPNTFLGKLQSNRLTALTNRLTALNRRQFSIGSKSSVCINSCNPHNHPIGFFFYRHRMHLSNLPKARKQQSNKDMKPDSLTVQTLNQYAIPLEKLLSKSLLESSDTSVIFF